MDSEDGEVNSRHATGCESFLGDEYDELRLISSFISDGNVVADLGCGEWRLKDFLGKKCDYIPVDCGASAPDAIACNLNSYCFPNIYADVVVVSSGLESIVDLEWFIGQTVNHADNKVIILFRHSSGINGEKRKAGDWGSRLSVGNIESKYKENGASLVIRLDIKNGAILIFKVKKKQNGYGVLVYPTKIQNLGDYTQALAVVSVTGRQEDAIYLRREDLAGYRGKPLPVICNGWFSHAPVYPPSQLLTPLYISLHITQRAQGWFMQPSMSKHLAASSPIGCRDQATANFLETSGIPAYHSSCVTLALGEAFALVDEESSVRDGTVYLVDPPVITPKGWVARVAALARGAGNPRLVYAVWPLAALQGSMWGKLKYSMLFACLYGPLVAALGSNRVVIQTQNVPIGPGRAACKDLFSLVKADLMAFRRASAVITGRIHVALPAAGAGAKVIFLMNKDLSSGEHDRVADHTEHFDYNVVLSKGRIPVAEILSAIEAPLPTDDRARRRAAITTRLKGTINGFLASWVAPEPAGKSRA